MMAALLSTELLRVSSRRLVRMAVLAALLGIAVTGVLVAAHSHGPSAQQLAAARDAYRGNLRQCLSGGFIPEDQLPTGQTLEEFCAQNVQLEFYLPGTSFSLVNLKGALSGTAVLLVLGGLLLGGSLAGAEWNAGTMATLLTWEPGRLRVLLAKAIAAAAVVMLLAIGAETVLSLVLWLVAATRGMTQGADGKWLLGVVGLVLRVSASAGIASLIGLAVAMIGRSTVAAVAVGFAYLGPLEGLIRGLRPSWQPWLLGDNVALFVNGRSQPLGVYPHEIVRTVTAAGLVASAYAVVLLAFAALSFRSRDVT
ncbi:MAG: hypothetical protein HY240_03465 [Actinobacteria bacterium]|nr:hypothetical protein [Actinomycetota bacterium]